METIERLESRIAPAGVVNASVANGKLILTGDVADNGFGLLPLNGVLRLSGFSGTEFSLNGGAPAGPFLEISEAIKSITIDSGGGADNISLTDLNLRSLKIQTGDGDDLLSLATTVTTKGITLDTGAGNDAVNLLSVSAGRNAQFSFGEGANDFIASVLSIGGNLDVTGGSGDDDLGFNSLCRVKHDFSLDLGEGGNAAAFTGVLSVGRAFIANFGGGNDSLHTPATGQTFVGGLAHITLGDGSNELQAISNSTHFGALKVEGGSGGDQVTIGGNELHVTGKSKFSLGDGNNHAAINTAFLNIGGIEIISGSGIDSGVVNGAGKIRGNVLIDLGSAADDPQLAALAGTGHLRITGGVTLSGSNPTGNSSVILEAVDIAGNLNVSVSGNDTDVSCIAGSVVAGNSSILADGSLTSIVDINAAKFKGGLSIKTGAGSDTLSLNNLRISGPLHIDTGSAADTLSIEALLTGTESVFAGAVKIALGDGDDSLNIGLNSSNAFAIFKANARFDGGAGTDAANVSAAGFGNQYQPGQPVLLNFEAQA